jgi:hypothetical protein
MYHRELPNFVEEVCNGGINLSSSIPLKNMNHNMIHNISFLDHCDHLCQKHNTTRLRLLSVIQQKLYGDMILRINKYSQFNNKLQQLIGEWGESVEPMDLFRCPTDCYDSGNISRIRGLVEDNDNDFNRLNLELKNDDSGLYDSLERLKNNYFDHEEDLRNNLIQIEERRNEYNPMYREILSDLSTKPKSYYMDNLLTSDLLTSDKENVMNNVNRRIINGIPENIHVIFLNSILLPTLISKCMEGHKSECMQMKEMLQTKGSEVNDIMERVGPGIPLSDSIMGFITNVKDFFDDKDDNLPSDESDDDSDEPDENKIEKVLANIVEPKKEMYHLKIQDTDDNNNADEDDEGDGGDNNNGDGGDEGDNNNADGGDGGDEDGGDEDDNNNADGGDGGDEDGGDEDGEDKTTNFF